MFFSDLNSVLRMMAMGAMTYISFLILLRISGKRSLSKLNVFDLVVSVAMGSVLASTITSSDLTLVDGLAAYGVLLLLQYLISKLSVYLDKFEDVLKSEPSLLLYEGKFLKDAMRKERVSKRDVYSILRQDGVYSIDEVKALVLETDGSFSVIKNGQGDYDTLDNLELGEL